MIKFHNIFLIGPMGAGKSTIGRTIAKELKLEFYDSDLEIEQRTGADLSWIYDLEGEDGFRKREVQVIDELSRMSNIVLATGGGVVDSPENRVALAGRGTVIYLKTSLEQQYERTKRDTKRPQLQQADDLRQRLIELWNEREPFYNELADMTFETDDNTVRTVANDIIKQLREETTLI